MSKRRVVITGLGMLTPCGRGWQPYWEAVLKAQSHIRFLSNFPLNGYPTKIAGEIPNFNPADFVKQRKSIKLMSREIQLGVAASYLAIQDAALNLSQIDLTRFGISLGTGIINTELDEISVGIRNAIGTDGKFWMSKFGQDGIRSMFPLWFLKYLPNMPACHISITHGLVGPSNTITTSSAAGSQAIGEAFRVIQRGDADLMMAGGTDSKVNAMGISRFNLLGLLSNREENPETAYRPFDHLHDGMVLGEGAGLVILEEWEHAKKRGAHIYGEVAGYGSSSDFNCDPRIHEDATGKRCAMVRALDDSEMEPDEVNLVVANGSGIPKEDIQESTALYSIFENSMGDLRVSGVKPITGHLVYGSGGVEIQAALLALQDNVVPPLANLDKPHPECELPFIKDAAEGREINTVLFNSFGFGGQNATLVIRKADR